MAKTDYEIAKDCFDKGEYLEELGEFTQDYDNLSPFGNYFVKITREQIQGLLDGKMYVFRDEYGTVIKLVEEDGE